MLGKYSELVPIEVKSNFIFVNELLEKPTGSDSNIILRVIAVSGIQECGKNKLRKVDVDVFDSTGRSTLVVWENLIHTISEATRVIRCMNVTHKCYQGLHTIGTASASIIEDVSQETTPEIVKLLELEVPEVISNKKSVIDVIDAPTGTYQLSDVRIKGVAKPLYYLGCASCTTKVTVVQRKHFFCKTCNDIAIDTTFYYRINLQVEEENRTLWVTLFNKYALQLMTIDALTFKNLDEPEKDKKINEIKGLFISITVLKYLNATFKNYKVLSFNIEN